MPTPTLRGSLLEQDSPAQPCCYSCRKSESETRRHCCSSTDGVRAEKQVCQRRLPAICANPTRSRSVASTWRCDDRGSRGEAKGDEGALTSRAERKIRQCADVGATMREAGVFSSACLSSMSSLARGEDEATREEEEDAERKKRRHGLINNDQREMSE